MNAVAAAIAALAILFLVIIFLLWRTRFGRSAVQVSHLVCGNCGSQFDYAWVPLMSFTAIRFGAARLFACPVCGKFAAFNIWNTRVDPETHHCDIRIGPS